MGIKRVIFIRPGETDWNRIGRWQGWVAIPLNAHGREQARRLANFVRNIGMSALYASDLRRAKETAEILAERLGFAPVYDSRLRERNIGLWQGLTLDEMRAWYPDDCRALLTAPDDFQVPSGESRSAVKARVLAVFNEIAANETGETIGILSHTTAIKALISELVPGCDERGLELENSSVTTIARSDDGGWRLVAVGDTLHLEGLEARAFGELEY